MTSIFEEMVTQPTLCTIRAGQVVLAIIELLVRRILQALRSVPGHVLDGEFSADVVEEVVLLARPNVNLGAGGQ